MLLLHKKKFNFSEEVELLSFLFQPAYFIAEMCRSCAEDLQENCNVVIEIAVYLKCPLLTRDSDFGGDKFGIGQI